MTRSALTVILAIAFISPGCKGKPGTAAAAEERPVVLGPADVAIVQRAAINTGAIVTGTLQPAWVVSVKAQVPGTITSIDADRGIAVRAGQVLATMRADGIRGQAQGARAAVAAAQAALAVADQRLESARTLRQAGALSEIDFKAAAAGQEAARAQLEAARAGAAAAFEAEGHATVRAPINGVVSARTVESGEAVSPGQPLFTVVRSDFLELAAQVTVEEAATIKAGLPVIFTLDAYPGREFKGEVSRIEPTANPDTRQVGVYVRLRNPGGVVGGQFASGRIQTSTIADALLIPASAVQTAANKSSVLVVENGRAVRRNVELGVADAANGVVQVKSGLNAGNIVIATAGATIADGARVQLASANPAKASGKE